MCQRVWNSVNAATLTIYAYLTFNLQTENCSRFWFQPNKFLKHVNDVYNELNNPNSDLETIQNPADVEVGQILAAVYPSDDQQQVEYYRAKVIYIERKRNSNTQFEVIYFIGKESV